MGFEYIEYAFRQFCFLVSVLLMGFEYIEYDFRVSQKLPGSRHRMGWAVVRAR